MRGIAGVGPGPGMAEGVMVYARGRISCGRRSLRGADPSHYACGRLVRARDGRGERGREAWQALSGSCRDLRSRQGQVKRVTFALGPTAPKFPAKKFPVRKFWGQNFLSSFVRTKRDRVEDQSLCPKSTRNLPSI